LYSFRVDEVHQLSNGLFDDPADLGITSEQTALLAQLIADLPPGKYRYKLLARGLGPCAKIVVKPDWKFPLLVKIGTASQIRREIQGYETLFLEIPSENLLPPVRSLFRGEMGAVAYRFVTGGRVKHQYRRLDDVLSTDPVPSGARAGMLDDIFRVALLKAHFRDGRRAPSEIDGSGLASLVDAACYENDIVASTDVERFRKLSQGPILSPYGIIHGDLHLKNIIMTRHDCPILIDYEQVEGDAPIYRDYAKFEISLQFHVTHSRALSYDERSYLFRAPVFAASAKAAFDHPYVQYATTIRRRLHRRCTKTAGLSSEEADRGYRLFLSYYLLRLAAAPYATNTARDLAREEARLLLCGSGA
jgi:hypothetical protein